MSEEELVAAIQGQISKFSSLADGTIRLQVDVFPTYDGTTKKWYLENGAIVALQRMVDGNED